MTMYIGEVVESNTGSFIADVVRDSEVPAFGSWVQIHTQQGIILYGVVSLVEYGSTMPGRRATALGRTREELQREMPQVMELLRTSFHGKILGYRAADGDLVQAVPPYPAGIHDFVAPCEADTVRQFAAPYDFLHLLTDSLERGIPGDELLVAALRGIKSQYHGEEQAAFLIEAGRVLSRSLRDDHQRLQTILRRVSG